MDKINKINCNEIIIHEDIGFSKLKLSESSIQLSDGKKKDCGFSLNQSVIDVEQNGYGISDGEDVLYTYGIEPCCGLVICDENVRILFHLDGNILPEDVIKITDKFNFSHDTMIIVIPGAFCGKEGSFDYKKIEEIYRRKGYEVIEQRIPATFGFISLDSKKVIIGTALTKDLDVVLPIPQKNKKNQLTERGADDIKELINLKQELLNINECYKGKAL